MKNIYKNTSFVCLQSYYTVEILILDSQGAGIFISFFYVRPIRKKASFNCAREKGYVSTHVKSFQRFPIQKIVWEPLRIVRPKFTKFFRNSPNKFGKFLK